MEQRCRLLQKNVTIIAEVYCQQLRCSEVTIQERRPERYHRVISQNDNDRLDTHPNYCPDLPSHFHLFAPNPIILEKSLMTTSRFKVDPVNSSPSSHRISSDVGYKNCQIVGG